MKPVGIVGAGLAGTEAALQLAERGIPVRLYEMRPARMTAAHDGGALAQLVCSNSFRGDAPANAVGLLKEEMRRAGGALIRLAESAAVPAGGALAVDRERFSAVVEAEIARHPNVEVVREEVTDLPVEDTSATLVTTGPLTSEPLTRWIAARTGEAHLYFYDAIAPIVDAESVDRDIAFAASRYDRGGDDYVNCPMDRATYEAFIEALLAAELAPMRDFEKQRFFEACLPIEVMAARGTDTPRFGPMKPVGLADPVTGDEPWAVVQLRTENVERTAYNLVGFQTRLKWGAQKEVLRLIPGLADAEFLRFGSVHRNTFVHGPRVLAADLSLRACPEVRLAGQITGVEGYVESMACGLIAAWSIAADLLGARVPSLPAESALGALRRHVVGELAIDADDFAPSNINWSMFPRLAGRKVRKRRMRRLLLAELGLSRLEDWLAEQERAGLRRPGFSKHDPTAERAAMAEERNSARGG